MPYLYPEASHAGPACRRPSCTGRGTVMGWASGWQAGGRLSSGTWKASLYCDQCDRQIETLHGERSEFLHGVEVDALRAADWDDLPEEPAI